MSKRFQDDGANKPVCTKNAIQYNLQYLDINNNKTGIHNEMQKGNKRLIEHAFLSQCH